MVALLQLYGSKNVGSGRVCIDWNILLQDVDNLDRISGTEQLRNASIVRCIWTHQNTWPTDNA